MFFAISFSVLIHAIINTATETEPSSITSADRAAALAAVEEAILLINDDFDEVIRVIIIIIIFYIYH